MKKNNKKDKNWKIKIGDLIVKTGSQDIVDLENKFIDNLDNLTEEGISCKLQITCMNKEDILVKITDIKCQMYIDCDICGKNYIANINSSEYICIFTTDEKKIIKEDGQEYYIIKNDMSIDISDVVHFAINLELTTVNRCPECQEKFDNSNYDEYEEESNINFINII